MTQGIYLDGNYGPRRRPKSKKEVREQVALDPDDVFIEATSLFGNDYEGPASEMPLNTVMYFVGPDPDKLRNFYGQIIRTEKGIKVT